MDITFLRSIATVLAVVAFVGVCWWAFSSHQKKGFEEAANLPFDDDAQDQNSLKHD